MVQLCIYTGDTYRKEIRHLWIIFLNLWIYILHFLAHIHSKDTNSIFHTLHTQYRYTQTNGHTQTHMDTNVVPLSHFALFVTCMYAKDTNFIFGMPQIYTRTDTQTHAHTSAETPTHTDTDTCTQSYISTHTDIQTHIHTYMYVIFSCHLPNELRSPWTYFFQTGIICIMQILSWKGKPSN